MQRLLFELIATSGLAAVFIVQLEGFGYVLEHGWRRWCRFRGWTHRPNPAPAGMFFLRVLLGGVLYASVFFWVGVLGILSPAVVLAVSAAVPIAAFVVGKRWRRFRPTLTAMRADWPILLGVTIFFAATLALWFRPITGFDGLWYHLPIPKFFLQEGNIHNLGGLFRYSLHPVMTYFWYLWPLSLDLTMPVKGMIVNLIQMLFLGTSLSYLLVVCRRYLRWRPWILVTAPLLLAITVEGLDWSFGTGFNDSVALAIGFVLAGLYVTVRKTKLTWELFGFGILAIIALATVKLYFTMCAVPFFIWFAWRAHRDLSGAAKVRRMLEATVVLGAIFYLPWLVRAYLESGRPLDPVGAPGLNEDSYRNAGSLTAENHWTSFIFTRFRDYLPTIAVSAYNPLFLVGMLSIAHPHVRKHYAGLWAVGFAGFWFVYFAAIVTNWRYMFPAAAILLFLGLVSVVESRKPTWFNLGWLTAVGALTVTAIFYNVRQVLPWTDWLILGLAVVGVAVVGYAWLKRDTRVLIGAVIVTLLIFSGAVIRIVTTHNGGNYIESGQSRLNYVDARSVFPYDAYPAATLTPPGYTVTEPIFAVGVHNLAYVENPTLEAQTTPQYFRGVTNAASLAERLKAEGVRFVLLMDPSLFPKTCQEIGVTDADTCRIENPEHWQIVSRDARKGPIWLELR